MKRRLFAAALCLISASSAWSLDEASRKLADRYRTILAENPSQSAVFDRLWKIYADAGETAQLVESCRQRAAEEPVLCARVLLRAGEKTGAGDILKKAAALGNIPAAEMLAGVLEEDGDSAAAALVLEKAVAVKETPSLLVRLGEVWLRAGDGAKSRAAWERAVALAPDDLSLRKKLAAACGQAGDPAAAVAHLKIVAEAGTPTERFAAWEEISRRLEESGKIEDAIAAQDALLALMGPGHWKLAAARQRLFALHQQARTLDVLEKKWSAAAESRPRDAEPALRMAELAKFQNNEAGRLRWTRTASDLLPKDAALAGEAAALELAAGHLEAAAALYDRALALRPQDVDLLFLRAEVSALSGQEAEAEKRIAEFLVARKGDALAEAHALDFYRRLHLSAPLERVLTARFSSARDEELATVELARFYLEKHRDADAISTLERFDDSHLAPKDAAAVALRFSEMLGAAKMNDGALTWARQAFERDAASPEYALHLADLLAAREEPEAARAVLEKACAASGATLPREDLERRLFAAVQAGEEKDLLAGNDREVRKMIAVLQQQAAAGTGEVAWLRLARWLRWNTDPPGAVTALREGFSKNPDSRVIQDALATALAETGDPASAIEELRKLAEAEPAKSTNYQRRIGHLQLDSGKIEEGLATFENLAGAQAKDWQAVADLALAEQMAGNWFRALETWRRAYGLAPAGSRRGLRPPLLHAASRLQRTDQGFDFLEEACAAERDAEVRGELFREAAAFAVQNRAADNWRARLDRRIKAAPTELFWKSGLVFLLEEQGQGIEARKILAESRQGADESEGEIQATLAAAEKAGDWNEAAHLLKRLMGLAKTPDAALAIRQAEYLERAGKIDEAILAWESVAARHARTPAALTAAADFFERTGDEARMEACTRAAARLGGCPPQGYLRLGRLALERGDRIQALADFEAVLAGTRGDAALCKDCLPLPPRILEWKENPSASVGFLPGGARTHVRPPTPWRKADDTDSEGCRLLAIQQIGQLFVNSPEKQKWLQGFSLPVERIWALYFSGEAEAAFAEIEKLAEAEDSPPALEQGFASLAMEAGEEARLARWASADAAKSGARWENILAALTRMLAAGWRPSEDVAMRLFTPAPALVRWQAARAFATKNFMRTACRLGESVPADLASSQAVAAWLELSNWRIALRDPDGAVSCLDHVIERAAPAVSFANPLFAAIRARWLLTPPDQRKAFEQRLAARLKTLQYAGGEAASRALIAALKQNHDEADREMAGVIAGLGVSEGEGWAEFIQQGGRQLEDWNLPRLARTLYRNDLARDPALLALRGENFRRSTESLLILDQLASATPRSTPYLLNEWLARGASDEELLQATIRLQQSGRTETAAAVFEKLCARDPRNEAVCAGIINLSAVSSLRKPAAAYLEKLLAGDHTRQGRPLIQNAALRLAGILEEDGDCERSLRVLQRLDGENAPDRTVLQQQVQLLCRMGRFREAMEKLEKQPAHSGTALPLAGLYLALGREADARTVLEKEAAGSSPESAAAKARLHELAGTLPAPSAPGNTNWEKSLRELDRSPMRREERFRAGRTYLATHRDIPEDLQRAELARLKKIVDRNPALLPEYYVLRLDIAEKSGTTTALEKELTGEWNDGRGRYLAGEVLIRLLLEQKRSEELGRLMDGYLTNRNFNEQAWDQIGQTLLLSGQPALAARVFSELTARAPGETSRALFLARALWQSGHQDEARTIIAPLERLALLDPPKHLDLALYHLSLDDVSSAKNRLRAAAILPGNSRAGDLWVLAAAQFIRDKRFDEAREAIVCATKNSPLTPPVQTIADYFESQGLLARLAPETNDFHLPERQFRGLQMEIVTRLIASGEPDRAWMWLENGKDLFMEPRWKEQMQTLEELDWNRAAKVWEIAAQSPWWDVQVAAAEFYLRRARAFPSSAADTKDLARSHELHPGSFAIASAYAKELLRLKKPAAARKILQDVASAYASPADRHAAREMLAQLLGP